MVNDEALLQILVRGTTAAHSTAKKKARSLLFKVPTIRQVLSKLVDLGAIRKSLRAQLHESDHCNRPVVEKLQAQLVATFVEKWSLPNILAVASLLWDIRLKKMESYGKALNGKSK